MSLTTPPSVRKLQTALHEKAKGSPSFRFYALYDKVYRQDVLAFAYDCCKANKGAAGVDDQKFEDIEEYGVRRWLDELAQELKSRTYQPQAVRRVMIDKPGGGKRPLGIGNGSSIGARTDIRGRPAARAICLSPGPQRFGCREACPQTAQHRPECYRSSRLDLRPQFVHDTRYSTEQKFCLSLGMPSRAEVRGTNDYR